MVSAESKYLMKQVFNLNDEIEAEEAFLKMKNVELNWTDDSYTLSDLLNSWNDISNEKEVTLKQFLYAFYNASDSLDSYSLTVDEINKLIVAMILTTKEDGSITGNAVKSIISRIYTEEVKSKLQDKSINVTKEDTAMDVFDKIKNHVNKFTDEDNRSNEILELSQIIGGVYHLVRTSAIINNL